MTSVTIKTCYGTVTVEVADDDLNFAAMMDFVVLPALRSIYSETTVHDWLEGSDGQAS